MATYNWELFLDFAKFLMSQSNIAVDKETANRIAISRAYYAAFHVAKDFLVSANISYLYAGGEHDRVCNTFKNLNKGDKAFLTTCHRIGNYLTVLKGNRHTADYDDRKTFNDAETKKCYYSAKQIIEDVKSLVQ